MTQGLLGNVLTVTEINRCHRHLGEIRLVLGTS